MNRREVITLIGGAAVVWPLAARAQQAARMRRVAISPDIPEPPPFLVGFAADEWRHVPELHRLALLSSANGD